VSDRPLTRKGAATRQRIIEGAALLIREHGPAETGLDDIRAATSTSKSQLFHYFPEGRAALFEAVAVHEAEQVIADQQPLLSNLGSWSSWAAWQRLIIAKYDEQRDRCPLGALTAQLGTSSRATRTIVTDLYDSWLRLLAQGVRALQASGEGRADVEPETAACSILVAIQGGVLMLQATDDLEYLRTGLRAAVDQLR
jgi:AcrR family transcriptional regulator